VHVLPCGNAGASVAESSYVDPERVRELVGRARPVLEQLDHALQMMHAHKGTGFGKVLHVSNGGTCRGSSCMHLALVAVPLRLIDGKYPERELMMQIAEYNTPQALALARSGRMTGFHA
jgi:hypothetical protein